MKTLLGIMAIAVVALMAVPALAANPWADCTDVAFNITIPPMVELWSTIGTAQQRDSAPAVALTVTNAGGLIPVGGKAQDAITYLGNTVPINVSVQLNGDIPVWTRFHVIIDPTTNKDTYTSVGAGTGGAYINVTATKVVTWDRRDTGYLGNTLGMAYPAFSGIASVLPLSVRVDYAVDAINGMPTSGATAAPVVLWTLSVTP